MSEDDTESQLIDTESSEKQLIKKYIQLFKPAQTTHAIVDPYFQTTPSNNRSQQVPAQPAAYTLMPETASKQYAHLIMLFVFILGTVFLFFLVYDIRAQHDLQIHRNREEIRSCYHQYNQNDCNEPVDILVEYCSRMSQCINRDPEKLPRLTVIYFRVLGESLKTFLEALGISGLIFILLLFGIYMCRPRHTTNSLKNH